VRFVRGTWECLFGGSVPVYEKANAELIVDRASISDRPFLDQLERKGRHKILDEGAPLLVCLTVKAEQPPPEQLKSLVKAYENLRGEIALEFLETWNTSNLAFVEVKIAGPDDRQTDLFDTDRGGLWLMTHGLEAVGLASTTVVLPDPITPKRVSSLNHAYTKLSEKFETWRISHTGNIYKRVRERSGKWYPLELLRNEALVKQEQEIASSVWKELKVKMALDQRRAS
jgi:hypothetical protein